MNYTENDIKVGTKLRCTKSIPEWWTVGKLYIVSLNDDGILQITDDNGHCAYPDYMVDCLNGKHKPVAFEIVEEEKEMTKYVEVTSLLEYTPDEEVIEIGKKYEVVNEEEDGVYIYANEAQPKYFIYNKQFKFVEQNDEEKDFVEQNEEEKEMKKYAKITKYFGRYNTDKRNGLEIGKEYEIVRFSDVSEDCWIYLNDKTPEYFISEKQYELVDEQQENPLVEMQQKVNNKIKLLKEERGRIIDKIERLDKHQRALKSKIDRLSDAEDALKILKDFK